MPTYDCGRHLIIIFHLLLLSDLSVFEVAATSIIHDPSLCTTSHRVMKSRYESYRETYIRKILWIKRVKTRINWRLDHYWTWETTEVCCTGYEPGLGYSGGSSPSCEPICNSGCYNGHCIFPNHCNCNDGYTHPEKDYSECVPDCPSGCHGGRCVEPKVCSCNIGYVLASDRGSCNPSCTSLGSGGPEGCGGNASCIAPQTCRCDEGYAILTNTTVTQDSSRSVDEASTTISPSPATDASVFKVGNITCKPYCESGCSANASCVAPNVCRCDNGYRSVPSDDGSTNQSRCVPICEKSCVNAACDYPNRCSCFPGYEPRTNDSSECQPVCKDSCVNAICAMPDRCECIGGYEKSLNTKPAGNVCAPICPGGCPNGNCIAPGICGCNEGYVLTVMDAVDVTTANSAFTDNDTVVNSTDGPFRERCHPICSPGCPSGSVCIAPQRCQMQLPLMFVHDSCSGNGALSKENDTCLCNHGWTGSRCEEAILCGIFHSLGNGTDDIITLKRLYYADNWDWRGPMCKEKCNECVSSLMTSANTSEDAVRCYHVDLFEATVGLVSSEVSLSEVPERANETLFCLFTAEAPCNVTKSDMTNVIVGCSTFILIVACALAWYLQRCNIKAIATRNAEGRDSSTLEPLHVKESKDSIDAVECICTLDSQT